jgi:hypothetical protein
MQVRFKVFRATFSSWKTLFQEAATFASEIPRDRLISISHSESNEGVVTVWYWAEEGNRAEEE